MNIALLIIDVQNDYFPNGKMELNNSLKASENIKRMLENFRSRSMPVIHVQHLSVRPGSTFFVPGTLGAEIHDNAKPLKDEKIFIKNYPNGFRETGLHEHLKVNNISRLIIAGMMTHMCVDTTVRAAYDLGYECVVVDDCCATKSLKINDINIAADDVQNAFLAALNGLFSNVMDLNSALELII